MSPSPTERTDALEAYLEIVGSPTGSAPILEALNHARELERELSAANATCAELVTDGNAITLAASLAKKSEEAERYRLVTLRQDAEIANLKAILSDVSKS